MVNNVIYGKVFFPIESSRASLLPQKFYCSLASTVYWLRNKDGSRQAKPYWERGRSNLVHNSNNKSNDPIDNKPPQKVRPPPITLLVS